MESPKVLGMHSLRDAKTLGSSILKAAQPRTMVSVSDS